MRRNSPTQTNTGCHPPDECTAQHQELMDRIATLTEAVNVLTLIVLRTHGTRITREQLAERLRVHRNTLPRFMARDPRFPRPNRSGKWLLSEIVEWEQLK